VEAKIKNIHKEVKTKEAYFSATQFQLIYARFRSNRSAMIAGLFLLIMILLGVFADFYLLMIQRLQEEIKIMNMELLKYPYFGMTMVFL